MNLQYKIAFDSYLLYIDSVKIAENIDTVKIVMNKSQKSNYHHGNLREVLLDTTLVMLEEGGIQSLSLRKLAARAGVSHNAPYMHFKDKEALLAAVAEQGFIQLSERLQTAVSQAGEQWIDQLHAGCYAYVELGLKSESLLQVMIRPFSIETYPTLSNAAHSSFEQLRELVVQGQDEKHLREGDSHEMAGIIWSLIQGITTILIGDKMPRSVLNNEDPKQLTARFVNQMLVGFK